MGVTRRFSRQGPSHPHPTLPHRGGGLQSDQAAMFTDWVEVELLELSSLAVLVVIASASC